MRNELRHKITGGERGIELIAWLSGKTGLSRNAAKRLIDARQVFVNNQRIWMARHVLETGDLVEIHGLAASSAPVATSIEVIWKDDVYLIINKPPGLLSNGPGSAENMLSEQLKRPVHAVHRLDRDTSGCMMLAWTIKDREKMIPLFQRREVNKIYEGLVVGKIPPGLESINRSIDGEEALTLIKVLQRQGASSRVEFTLVTGRTHQIRRHLQSHGLHLAGEKNYGKTVIDNPALRGLRRHMLHAKMISFPHPVTGKRIQVRAALPEDFKAAAKALGL